MVTAAAATGLSAPLQVTVPGAVEEAIGGVIAFLPQLAGALAILILGWLVGVGVGRLVSSLVDRTELDRFVRDTPLGGAIGGTQQAVSRTFGLLARWFVYALAILAAADVLAIPTLSSWIQTAVSYLPAFVAGLLIIVVGFVVADFIGDMIARTRAATQTAYTSWFATGTRLFLYFTAIVIGLDTMGINVDILFVFANALAWGVAAAVALGAGIAIGWGGKDYVADNIGRWMGSARSTVSRPGPGGAGQTTSDGGTDDA